MSQNNMTIYDHIEELRKRLMFVAVFFVLAVIVSFFLAQPLIKFIQSADVAQDLTMHAFRVTDSIKIYFQITFVLAFIIISPIILYQLWAFVSPGLLEKERRITLFYIPFAVLLFLGGISFSYFVLLPFVIKFMMNLSTNMNIETVLGINEYFQFIFQITLPFGFLFQMPVLMLFLARLGIVTPDFLSSIRKYAYFVLFIIAAFITPPDLVSHLVTTMPLFILYEISVWLAKIGHKKSIEAHEEYMEDTNEDR